jgi:hypothetical protein
MHSQCIGLCRRVRLLLIDIYYTNISKLTELSILDKDRFINNKHTFILDSAATSHIVSKKEHFHTYKAIDKLIH